MLAQAAVLSIIGDRNVVEIVVAKHEQLDILEVDQVEFLVVQKRIHNPLGQAQPVGAALSQAAA
jgi:hypothetical protein